MGSLLFFIIKIHPPWIIVFVGGFRLHMGLSRLLKDYKSKGTDPKVLLIELRNQTQPISIVLQNVLQSPFYLLFSFVFLRWKLKIVSRYGVEHSHCQELWKFHRISVCLENCKSQRNDLKTLLIELRNQTQAIQNILQSPFLFCFYFYLFF